MGITRWQKGISPSIMSDSVNIMPPLASIRLEMKEMTKAAAMVIKRMDRYRSVLRLRASERTRCSRKRASPPRP